MNTEGVGEYFACNEVGDSNGYITASGSARLTGTEITITDCSFVDTLQDGSTTPGVTVSVTGQDVQTVGAESSQVSISTKVFLRTY